MQVRLAVLTSVVLLLSFGAGAFGATYFVATNGSNGNPGTITQPWATLSYAVSMVSAGDTINVRAGNYTQNLSWDTGGNGTSGALITIQAYDGDLTAHFIGPSGTLNTFWMAGRTYVNFIGLDISGAQSNGYYCVKIDEPSQYVALKRCYIHDSGSGDVVKLTPQSDYLTVEGCEISRPGGDYPSGNNQGIDAVDVDYLTYRNNYIHDFPDNAYYAKGGSEYTVVEGNVLYNPNVDNPGPAAGFGQETDYEFMDGATFQSYYMVMRNNIFSYCDGGAAGTYDCYHGYFYNNLVHNCGGGTLGIIHQRSTGDDWTPATEGFYVRNNIFIDTRGQMPTVYDNRSGSYSDWQTGYNNYYNNGLAIPSAGIVNPNNETGRQIGDPDLTFGTTPSTWQGWVNYYRPKWSTQSNNMLKDKGASAGGTPVPAVTKDIDGTTRPQGTGYDIGPYESAAGGTPPVANFTGNPTSGYAPLTVAFTDTSTNTPTSWSWTFGDGGTSTSQNPSHSYSNAGSYTVSLTAANAYGSDGETKSNYITVNALPSPPVANFSGTPTSGPAPLSVSFTDQSTNTPTSWSWNFGDSTTSTSQNPSHSYAAGTYTVSLRATNAGGYDDEVKTNYITATNPPPVANFTANLTSGVAPLAVNFTDTSTNTPTSWSWSFGDGSTSTSQHPSHTYNGAGYYTVSLTATNAAGSDSEVKTNYLTVYTEAIIYPGTWESTLNTVTLLSGGLSDIQTDNSVYMVFRCNQTNYRYFVRYKWTPGYAPSQIAKMTVEYQWKNTSAVTPTFCNSIKKSDGSFYETAWRLWTTTDQTWSWETTDPATYFYNNEIWVDLCGCNQNTTSYDVSVDMCRIKLWLMPSAPVANFTGSPTSGAAPLAVTFTDSSTNTPTSWSWNFGDGSTSTSQNPSHTYNSAGTYTVSLRATNTVGYDDEAKTSYITVTVPPPVAAFTGAPTSGMAPLPVSFTDQSTNTPTSWSWNFGDGSTSTSQNPSHSYAAGTYTVSLRATNAGGYDDEVKTNYITATVPPPVANFSGTPTSGTAPLAVAFTDSSTNTPTSWSWNFGDSTTSTSQNPSHSFAAGTFTVSLRATNAAGYDDEIKTNYITATVPAPVAAFSGSPTSGTAPLSVSFTDSSTNTPTSWSWNFGDSTTSTSQNPSHSFAAGTFTVSLRATNAGGYDDEVKTNYITATSGGATTPTFVAAGAIASGTGAITPALPTGIQSNDILLLFLETANQAISISNQNGGTWAAVTNSPQGTGTAASSTATRLTVYWSRYNGTQGVPTTSDSGDHQLGRIIAVRGCVTSGDPWGVSAGGVEATADTSGAIPGATTTVASTLVVAAISTSLPDASGTANFSAWANANLTSLAEQTDNTVTAGNGGGLSLATGEKATTGAYGATSVTCATSSTKALFSVALKPAIPVAPVANFTADTTLGVAPLAVSFTDTSTNTPTSWSWNFGDSTTSTSQNPSHTYNSTGYYTVSLTAANPAGSDGETKTNYITVCSQESIYPTSWYTPASPDGRQVTVVSGALSDVQSDNNVYFQLRCNASAQKYWTRMVFTPTRASATVAKLTLDYQWRCSLGTTPLFEVSVGKSDGTFETVLSPQLWSTSDQTFSWSTTNAGGYYYSNGGTNEIRVALCGCPQNTSVYDAYLDLVRITFWVLP